MKLFSLERSDSSHEGRFHEVSEGDRFNNSASDAERVMDVRDLVYKGGFNKDPQEVLENPAVVPEMLQEGRDLRVDLFRDSEEADQS